MLRWESEIFGQQLRYWFCHQYVDIYVFRFVVVEMTSVEV